MKILNNLHGFIWGSMTENNANTYLIDGKTPVLIDPGHAHLFQHVQQGLEGLGRDLGDIGVIICTHAHPDHIEGVQVFEETASQFAMHEKDWELVKSMENASRIDVDKFKPDFFIKEGDCSINGLNLRVFHTPGHSPGSVSLYWPDKKVLFTGDLIFKDGVGRTDLPGGDGSLLKESIKRLKGLEIEWLLPGHGDMVSGAKEVRANFDHLEHFYSSYV
jgi:glyoxylase-like metal-dependent hydrolase (beta-lactamase superfamily II)